MDIFSIHLQAYFSRSHWRHSPNAEYWCTISLYFYVYVSKYSHHLFYRVFFFFLNSSFFFLLLQCFLFLFVPFFIYLHAYICIILPGQLYWSIKTHFTSTFTVFSKSSTVYDFLSLIVMNSLFCEDINWKWNENQNEGVLLIFYL